jgi:hypothetical protein
MGEQDPIKDPKTRDIVEGVKPHPKSHDPEADRENAWNDRDRFEPAKPGGPTPAGDKAIPKAH